jgi:hypothetical protein
MGVTVPKLVVALVPSRTWASATGLRVTVPPPAVTVTCAVPLLPPLAAVTVNGPPAVAPAVKSPAVLIVPPPETVHVKVGWLVSVAPNWSFPLAVNCWVPPAATLAVAGVTVTLVRVCDTVIETDEVTVWLAASLMDTCRS